MWRVFCRDGGTRFPTRLVEAEDPKVTVFKVRRRSVDLLFPKAVKYDRARQWVLRQMHADDLHYDIHPVDEADYPHLGGGTKLRG